LPLLTIEATAKDARNVSYLPHNDLRFPKSCTLSHNVSMFFSAPPVNCGSVWQKQSIQKSELLSPHEPRFSLKIQGFPVSLFLFSFYLGQLGQVKSKIHIKESNIKIFGFELPRLPHLTAGVRKNRINTGFSPSGRHIFRGSDGAAHLP